MQNISVNGYVLHVSHLSFVNFVSSTFNENKHIVVLFFTWISLIKIVSEQTKRGSLIQEPQT